MNEKELKGHLRRMQLQLHSQREKLSKSDCAFLLEIVLKQMKELAAATEYIAEYEVIHKKIKKDIPTVIEYKGKRYVLDYKE
jgi:hypothetical protein